MLDKTEKILIMVFYTLACLGAVLMLLVVVLFCFDISFASAESETPIATVYISQSVSDFVNGRSKPTTKSSSEARFYPGDELSVLEFSGEWTKVVGGESGCVWVKTEYTTASPPGSDPQPHVVIGNGRVHVRNAPDGDHVKWLSVGDKVTVIGWVGSWAQIKDGYVKGTYLKPVDE